MFLINAINAAANNFAANPNLEPSEKVVEILKNNYLIAYGNYIGSGGRAAQECKLQVWELEAALKALGQKEADLNLIRQAAIDARNEKDFDELENMLS
jgi:hypothetical protein